MRFICSAHPLLFVTNGFISAISIYLAGFLVKLKCGLLQRQEVFIFVGKTFISLICSVIEVFLHH